MKFSSLEEAKKFINEQAFQYVKNSFFKGWKPSGSIEWAKNQRSLETKFSKKGVSIADPYIQQALDEAETKGYISGSIK